MTLTKKVWQRLLLIGIISGLLMPIAAFGATTDNVQFNLNGSIFSTETDAYGNMYFDSLEAVYWDRVRTGVAPWSGNLTIGFSADVDLNRYTFSASLVSPSGVVTPLIGTTNSIRLDLSSSCYLSLCHNFVMTYPVQLPATSEIGAYSIQFVGSWTHQVCQGTVCQTDVPISKSVIVPNALVITPLNGVPISVVQPKIKKVTLICVKGNSIKKIVAPMPKCPKGYRKK